MIRKRRMLCWCRRNITAQEWKVNNGKIEVIPFVVKLKFRAGKSGLSRPTPSSFSTYRDKAVLLFHFLFVCDVCFVIICFLISFFCWCLRKAVLRDFGIARLSSFISL